MSLNEWIIFNYSLIKGIIIMVTKKKIIEIIFKSIEEMNQLNDNKIILDVKTQLFGGNCGLDSLGLVNLIVSIEGNINSEYNVSISIADEKAMSQKHSQFKSVDTLADYVVELLNNK